MIVFFACIYILEGLFILGFSIGGGKITEWDIFKIRKEYFLNEGYTLLGARLLMALRYIAFPYVFVYHMIRKSKPIDVYEKVDEALKVLKELNFSNLNESSRKLRKILTSIKKGE